MFVGFYVLGWSYMRDIAEAKGRRTRKAYPLLREDGTVKAYHENRTYLWAKDRLNKEDPNWTKFLEHKPRASAHH